MSQELPQIPENIPLHLWPSHLFGTLQLCGGEKFLLNLILNDNNRNYNGYDIDFQILYKTFSYTTRADFSMSMGIFHTLMYFNNKDRFPKDIFYEPFDYSVIKKIRHLEQNEIINTPEDFISSLIICSLRDIKKSDELLLDISNGRKATDTLKSFVNDVYDFGPGKILSEI
jgi:hypothetical protein